MSLRASWIVATCRTPSTRSSSFAPNIPTRLSTGSSATTIFRSWTSGNRCRGSSSWRTSRCSRAPARPQPVWCPLRIDIVSLRRGHEAGAERSSLPTTPPFRFRRPKYEGEFVPASRSTRSSIRASGATSSTTGYTKGNICERFFHRESGESRRRGGTRQEDVRSRRAGRRQSHVDRRLLHPFFGDVRAAGAGDRGFGSGAIALRAEGEAAARRGIDAGPLDPDRLRRFHRACLHRGLPALLRSGTAVGRCTERDRGLRRGGRETACLQKDVVSERSPISFPPAAPRCARCCKWSARSPLTMFLS